MNYDSIWTGRNQFNIKIISVQVKYNKKLFNWNAKKELTW